MRGRLAALVAGTAALALASGGAAGAVPAVPQGAAAEPLVVTDVRPDGGSTGFPLDTSVFVHFDRGLDSSTLRGNASIKRVGAPKPMSASLGYLPPSSISGPIVVLNPTNDLRPGTRYQVTLSGGKDGIRAEDTGRLGYVTDASARFENRRVTWSFTTVEAE